MWTSIVFLQLWFFASSNGQAEDPCEANNGGCKFLCVPAPDQSAGQLAFTCDCPPGMTLHPHDPRDCIEEFPKPESVEAVRVSDSTVELRWRSPHRLPSLPLLQFRVHVREGSQQRLNIINLLPDQRRFLLPDLLPDTRYHVVVEAVYSESSALAHPVTFRTRGLEFPFTAAPTPRSAAAALYSTPKSVQKSLTPSRVRKVRVTSPDDTSLRVSWLPPRNHDQVDVVDYRVKMSALRAAKRGAARAERDFVVVEGTEALLEGLQPGTRYRVTVTPRTSSALGTPRSKVASTTGLAPALRVHVGAVRMAGDSVLVKWGLGGLPDSPKVTFSVFYRTLINSTWSQWTALPQKDSVGFVILQTQEGAGYEFLVQARVPGRPAPLTSVIRLPEARSEVLPPEDISVQVTEGGRLLVRWQPREHADVIGYAIRVVQVDSRDVPRGQTRSQAVLGNHTQQELSVERGHKYRLQMASLTLAGSSSASRPVYFRVPAESQPFVRGELRGSEQNASSSTRNRPESDEEEIERAPPEIVLPFPSQRDVTEGAAFTFTCRVRSLLEPSIQWIRRVNELAEDGERPSESTFEIEGQLFAMLAATDTELGEDGFYVSSYVIPEATPRDAGMYVCVATNSRGYTVKDTHLSVLPEEQYSPAVVPPYPRDVMVKAGDPVSFTCRIESQTRPTIKWLRQVGAGTGDSVEVEGRHFAELPSQRLGREQGVYSQRLDLDEVYEEDAGLYLCMATNAAGSAFRTASLVVTPGKTRPYLPVFLAPYPQNLTANEGDTVSFTCRVKSDGKPVMQWLKSVGAEEAGRLNASSTLQLGGQTFQPLRVHMTQSWDGAYVSRLTLIEVVARDAATYVCLVSNAQGYRFRAGSLTVQKPETLGFSPPKFLEPLPENSTVLVGTPVRLFCRVSSVLEPSIKWIRTVPPAFASQFDTYEEGGLLYTGVAATPSRPSQGGVLVSRVDIPSAQPSHAGTYLCLATNAAGLVKLRVSLEVLLPEAKVPLPRTSPLPPGAEAPTFFHALERDVTITEGASLLLQCSFNSSHALPPPRVQWVMEASRPDTGDQARKSLGEGELLPVSPGSYVSRFLMTSPIEAGEYLCVVQNDAGTSTASINVNLEPAAGSAPGARDVELSLEVLEQQADRLLVGWSPPPLPSLDYFSLQLSSPALPLPRTASPQGSAPRLWLYQLQPDTQYTLNLTARACSGLVLAWDSLHTRTLVADRPLLLVTTEAVDGGLLRVTWRGWGLPLVNGFHVTLQQPALAYTRSVTARPEQDSVWLGVMPGTTYDVTVAALSTSDDVIAQASVNVTTPANFSAGNDVRTVGDDFIGSDVTTTRSVTRAPFVSTPYSQSGTTLYSPGSSTPYLQDGEKSYLLPDTEDGGGAYVVRSHQGGREPLLRGKDGQIYDVRAWTSSGVLHTPPGQPYTLAMPKNGEVYWSSPHFPLPLLPVDELVTSYRLPRLISNPAVTTVYVVLAAYDDTLLSFDRMGGGSADWSVRLGRLGQTTLSPRLTPGTLTSTRPVAVFHQTRPRQRPASLTQMQMSPRGSGGVFPAVPFTLPPQLVTTPKSEGRERQEDTSMPRILRGSVTSVSVSEGDTALLPCLIADLGNYTVSWTDRGDNLLTFRERRMIPDERFRLQRSGKFAWNLVVSDVTPKDQGPYFCTVNTEPPLVSTQHLTVTEAKKNAVTPTFLSAASTVIVGEGDTAILPCSVSFHGDHMVAWLGSKSEFLTLEDRRLIDDPRFSVDRPSPLDFYLRIADVSPSDEGPYFCSLTTNPPIKKDVRLVVRRV